MGICYSDNIIILNNNNNNTIFFVIIIIIGIYYSLLYIHYKLNNLHFTPCSAPTSLSLTLQSIPISLIMVDSSSGAMIPVVDANGSVALANIHRTMLNPNAPEWCLENNRADEDDRCLFITFSKWLPTVNEREITLFFNQYVPHLIWSINSILFHKPLLYLLFFSTHFICAC